MRRRSSIVLLLILALPACGQTPTQFNPLPSSLGDVRGVAMGFERLRPLGAGEGLYAAFINVDRGEILSLGVFNVNAAGQPIDESGQVIERFTADKKFFDAVAVVVTLEPTATAPERPVTSPILQGPFVEGVAALAVPVPIGVRAARGSYRVFTPTDGPGTNEGSGTWAVSADNEPLLQIPPANNVYNYEGFMIVNGEQLTMGRFNVVDQADTANPFSGSLPAPEFPGEDFLVNSPPGLAFPADLTGARLLVTLEPRSGDFAAASQLVILEAVLPAVVGGEIIELVNRTANFPTGTAVIY